MLYHLENNISNSLGSVFESCLGQRVKYTAINGSASISTANTNLNGTGTLGTVIGGSSNGSLIKAVTIKAAGTTTMGMVRLFLSDTEASDTWLIAEFKIPARTVSSIDESFGETYEVDFGIPDGYFLKASTEKAETFIVTADGYNISYP